MGGILAFEGGCGVDGGLDLPVLVVAVDEIELRLLGFIAERKPRLQALEVPDGIAEVASLHGLLATLVQFHRAGLEIPVFIAGAASQHPAEESQQDRGKQEGSKCVASAERHEQGAVVGGARSIA